MWRVGGAMVHCVVGVMWRAGDGRCGMWGVEWSIACVVLSGAVGSLG